MNLSGLAILCAFAIVVSSQTRQPATATPAPLADAFPGTDIGAKINAAFEGCRNGRAPCVVVLDSDKTYRFSTTIRFPGTRATLDCNRSVLQFTAGGDAIYIPPGPTSPPFLSGGLKDCTVIGTAAPHSIGIHQQSRIGFVYDGVAVRDFPGPESACVWWESVAGIARAPRFNEQNVVRKMDLGNCTTLFRMSRTSGTDSFAYNRIEDLHLDIMDGQVGLSVDGNGSLGSVSLIQSEINIRANVNASRHPGKVIAVTNGGRIEGSRLAVLAEQTSGNAGSYGLYVDSQSVVYVSGTYSAGNLKTFDGGRRGSLVMTPTLNPTTGSIHFEAPPSVIQQRHCKYDLGPVNATFWLASYGGAETNCSFQLLARNTSDHTKDVDANVEGTDAPVNVLYADGKTKAVGIGAGFSTSAPPDATLAVNGAIRLGTHGTPISKLARYEASATPPAIGPRSCASHTISVPGLEAEDVVLAVNPASPSAGVTLGGFSAAAGKLTVSFCNFGAEPVTPPAGKYRIAVLR